MPAIGDQLCQDLTNLLQGALMPQRLAGLCNDATFEQLDAAVRTEFVLCGAATKFFNGNSFRKSRRFCRIDIVGVRLVCHYASSWHGYVPPATSPRSNRIASIKTLIPEPMPSSATSSPDL